MPTSSRRSFRASGRTSYAPYFARKFVRRLKAEEVYDSLVGATNLFTDVPIRGTDVKVKLRRRSLFAGRVRQGRERSDPQGDPLLPRVVRPDEPAILRAQQRRRDHPGRAADEQSARPSSDPGGGGKLPGRAAQAGRARRGEDRRLYERFLVRRPTPAEVADAKEVVSERSGGMGRPAVAAGQQSRVLQLRPVPSSSSGGRG